MRARVCMAAALVAGAAVAKDYEGYVNWEWRAVEVSDTNASANVRNQMDFTVPVHGPWLTVPSETGMTVTWITRIPCAGGIEYREKGTTNWVERWPVKYGQIDYSKDIQSFHLTGLKPGTEYEYRLLSNVDNFSTPYHMVICRGREIHEFRTIDPKRESYKVWVTSDFHGGARLCLDPMIRDAGAADSDFFFFLGDNVEDGPKNNIRYYTTFGYLDDVTRKWGTTKPTIFIRGNHDVWGIDTYRYGDYFPQPDGKTYYAFRQGPCYFVAIDTMWIPKENLQKQQWENYLVEQRDWLRGLKRTQGWKDAKFRIVMFHVPMFPGEGQSFPYDYFGETLADETPEGRIHAVITGHEHAYARINPNTKETRFNNQYKDVVTEGPKAFPQKWYCRNKFPERFPYVDIVCHLCESMTIEVSPEKLVFKSHRWAKPEGGYYDAFELTPDGQVRDLVDVTVLPWPQPEPPKAKKK